MSRDATDEFIRAACVPRDGPHADGRLDPARAILARDPEVAQANIHTAAILGDATGVRTFLARDRTAATTPGGPYGWDALTHLCFSNFLKLDPARSDGFVAAATALLDAGASANTGFHEPGHAPAPEFESVLYGACGVAHHAALTALLLARGADPNDEEVTYHAPETYDNAALRVLLASGKLTADSLATLLLRKSDWHDLEGIELLLAHGADPARPSRWSANLLVHAISRDNAPGILEALLAHGADPRAHTHGVDAIAAAARAGRGDLLHALERRGVPRALAGADALLAECALGRADEVARLAQADPSAAHAVREAGPVVLARFAGIGNRAGVALLLDLGLPADLPLAPVRGYWTVPAGSTALHVAAWRGRHDVVALLLARGAAPDRRDADGATPLALAIRAGTDSHWADRRAPGSIEALLAAGASAADVRLPTGWEEADRLLSGRGPR